MARQKRSRACDISKKVRYIVVERDRGRCIWCGKPYAQICHYISRGSNGLGIHENLVCGCYECHREADQGTRSEELKQKMKSYLRRQYPNWNEAELRYKKDE